MPCCAASTEPFRSVVHVQRNASVKAKYFAKESPLWCNNDNFPKGGWPGDPAGAQKCLHLVTPSHRSPMFNLGETCMKKSLIALAVLAFAGTASAQSSVTLFGFVDAALQHVSNGGGAGGTRMVKA